MWALKNSTNLPITFFRDFNEILYDSKKDRGQKHREAQISGFQDVIDEGVFTI